MGSRLLDAARDGNVEILLELIKEDWRILHTVALSGGETPLHTACLAGHLHFVEVVIKLMPDFAWELNPDGFSPLHIASAKGYVEIARELLRIDRNLCMIEGMERRIPLHSAVIKGRVEVVRELIAANTDTVESVTARGETALHLAVKHSQFKAFLVLVEHLKQVNKEDVLNMKDDQGNTILHLAVSRKQYQVVDLLLNEQVVPKETMDLNSLNKRGLAPLDVLQLFQSEAGDREIEDILRQSGAKRTEELLSPTDVANTTSQNELNPTNGYSSNRQSRPHLASQASQLVDYFKYQKLEDSPGEVINILLVIVILIATATYQAVLSPPGGVWQEDRNGTNTAGKAVMGSKNPIAYGFFLLLNSIGFFMSIYMIQVLTFGFPMRLELIISMFALVTTYDTSMGAIAPNSALNYFFIGISIALPIVLPLTIKVFRDRSNRRNEALSGINQESA